MNAFGSITFGTFAAIIIGAVFCCLGCVVGFLICCRKKIQRRTPPVAQRVQPQPNTVASQLPRTRTETPPPLGPLYEHSVEVEPPPRYEDLQTLSDSPPPYEPPTLLTLSKMKAERTKVVMEPTVTLDPDNDYAVPGTATESKVT